MDQEPDELVADEVIEFEENSQTSIVVSDGSSTTLNKIKSLARNKKALAGVATAALLTAAASAAFILIHSPDVAEDGQATETRCGFHAERPAPAGPKDGRRTGTGRCGRLLQDAAIRAGPVAATRDPHRRPPARTHEIGRALISVERYESLSRSIIQFCFDLVFCTTDSLLVRWQDVTERGVVGAGFIIHTDQGRMRD